MFSSHYNSLSSSQPTKSPSRQPSFQPSNQPSSVPTLSYNTTIRNLRIATNISFVLFASADRTSIEVGVQLPRESGRVYCAAFKAANNSYTFNPPRSAGEIVSQASSSAGTESTVNVKMSGLSPITNYTIFCVTRAVIGTDLSALQNAYDTKTTISTACCKAMTLKATAGVKSVILGQSIINGLTLTLDSLPTSNVIITLSFDATNTFSRRLTSQTNADVTFSPDAFTITSKSTLFTYTSTITASTSALGYYKPRVTISGPSASQYNVSYAFFPSLRVLNSTEEPPVPTADGAQFSNDGLYVIVSFSSATNRGGYTNLFPCTAFLHFDGDSRAICQWSDDQTMTIYPVYNLNESSLPIVSVGSNVTIKAGGLIKAICSTSVDPAFCANWTSIGYTVLNVTGPASIAIPVVKVTAPFFITACQTFTFDITASSGSAGREWKRIAIVANAIDRQANVFDDINQFFIKNYSYSPPTPVPVGVLTAGFQYSFKATLCNFLGACGTTSHVVSVVNNGTSLPTAVFVDSSSVTTYRRLPLTVEADAYARTCENGISYQNMRYNWSLSLVDYYGSAFTDSQVSNMIKTLKSTSQNPSTFRLSSYGLYAPASYILTLQAYQYSVTNANPTVAAISSTISVLEGQIYAIISGGSRTTIRFGRVTQIDASSTYDEDVQTRTGRSAGLSFFWSCIQIAPQYDATCNNTISLLGTRSSDKITVRPLALNGTSRLSVLVTDSNIFSSRTATAYVDITVADTPLNEIIVTTSPADLVNIRTDLRLALSSSIKVVSSCVATWSVDDATINLPSVALTPISRILTASSAPQSFNLAITAGALPQRASLTFTITCGTVQSVLQISTNGAPLPGSFSISPSSGIELTTSFLFLASQWSDKDLPISYQFGYISIATEQTLTILSRTAATYKSTQLPAGASSNSYQVNCSLVVYDAYNASISVFSAVGVQLLTSAERTARLDSLISSTASTGGVVAQKTLLSLGSDILNYPNCTAAPNCTLFNRKACSTTSNTCGSCLSGFTGENENSNTICISRNATVSKLLGACNTTADCGNTLLVCGGNHTCEYIDKTCHSNCSSQGTCVLYYISTGRSLTSCKLNQDFCEARCSCNDGYFGLDCSTTRSNLLAVREQRTSLVNTLVSLVTVDDINSETVQSWSGFLASVSSNAYELPSAAAKNVQQVASTTISKAKALQISHTKVTGVLKAISVVEGVGLLRLGDITRNGSSSSRRSMLSADDDEELILNTTTARSLSILSTFADVIHDSKVYGEDVTDYLYDNFRLSSNTQQIQDQLNVSIIIPSTDLEILTDALQTSVTVDSSYLNPNSSLLSEAYALTGIQMRQKSFTYATDQFYSDPLRLQINTPTNSSSVLKNGYIQSVYLAIKNNEAITSFYNFGNETLANFTTYCPEDVLFVETFICPVSRQEFVHNCTGFPGYLESYCPIVAPTCSSINVTSLFLTPMAVCNVYNHSAEMTFCRCEVLPSEYTDGNRRLSYAEENYYRNTFGFDNEDSSKFIPFGLRTPVTVNYNLSAVDDSAKRMFSSAGASDFVAATIYLSQDFRNTFKAIRRLNNFQNSRIVFALLSSLWGFGILLFLYVNYREQSVAKEQDAKRKKALAGKKQSENETLAEKMKAQISFYIETIVPAVYGLKETFMQRTWREITLHHRYFHLLVPDARRPHMFDRFYRTIKVLTILTLTMFVQAALYDLQDPSNDGSCDAIKTEVECLSRKRVLDSSQHYCYYHKAQCYYNDEQASEQAVVYVLVISTLVTIMAKMPVDALLKIWISPVAPKQSKIAVHIHPMDKTVEDDPLHEEHMHEHRMSKAERRRYKNRVSRLYRKVNPAQKLLSMIQGDDRLKVGQGRAMPEIVTTTQQEATTYFKEAEDRLAIHNKVLALQDPSKQQELQEYQKAHEKRRNSFGSIVSLNSPQNNSLEAEVRILPEDEVEILCQDIIIKRKTMVNGAKATEVYDHQWDIRPDFDLSEENVDKYHKAFYKRTKDAFYNSLDNVYEELDESEEIFRALNPFSAGVELMHTFMIDLLGRKTKAAKIFRQKFSEDFERLSLVSQNFKYFAIAAIFAANGFFIFYILLRGVEKGLTWQFRFMVSVIVQLSIEVFLFETLEIFWLQFVVPESVREDVKKALAVLEIISQNTQSLLVSRKHAHEFHGERFDAPTYFFISKKFSKLRPELPESAICLAYRNYYPGLICRTWPHYQRRLKEQQKAKDNQIISLDAEDEEEDEDELVHVDELDDNLRPAPLKTRTRSGRYMQRAYRNAREAFNNGAIVYGILVGAASALVFFLRTLGGFPMIYQKLIVRMLQTGILTGTTLLFYFALRHPAFFVFFVILLLILIGVLICRSYYIEPIVQSKLLPTSTLAAELTHEQEMEEGRIWQQHLEEENRKNMLQKMMGSFYHKKAALDADEEEMVIGFQKQLVHHTQRLDSHDQGEDFSFSTDEEGHVFDDEIDEPAAFIPVAKPKPLVVNKINTTTAGNDYEKYGITSPTANNLFAASPVNQHSSIVQKPTQPRLNFPFSSPNTNNSNAGKVVPFNGSVSSGNSSPDPEDRLKHLIPAAGPSSKSSTSSVPPPPFPNRMPREQRHQKEQSEYSDNKEEKKDNSNSGFSDEEDDLKVESLLNKDVRWQFSKREHPNKRQSPQVQRVVEDRSEDDEDKEDEE